MYLDKEEYKFIQYYKNPQLVEGFYVKTHLFKFKAKNKLYIVHLDEFDSNIFILKFYLKSHSQSEDKFKLLTNERVPRKIVNTCISICLDVFKKNDKATFGFVGEQTLNEKEQQKKVKTKRYTFYMTLVLSYITDNEFLHYNDDDNSTYALISKKNNTDSIIKEMNKMHSVYSLS